MAYDWNEILKWFSEDPEKMETPTEIIYAEYDDGGYDGQAWVLFYDNGKFWYVEGSHCSCYGLEDQWSPEEYSPETLAAQVERATYGFFKDQKGLIMAAVEKYSSPLGQLAAEYARVEGELNRLDAEYKALGVRRDDLEKQKAELKHQLKMMLD